MASDQQPGQTATELNEDMRKQRQKDDWHYKFTNHTPSLEAIGRIESLRSAHKAMADAYIDLCPVGREQSLALTHLEEASFHAISAIVREYTLDNAAYAAAQPPAEAQAGPAVEQNPAT